VFSEVSHLCGAPPQTFSEDENGARQTTVRQRRGGNFGERERSEKEKEGGEM
jgi:hypothetical protein